MLHKLMKYIGRHLDALVHPQQLLKLAPYLIRRESPRADGHKKFLVVETGGIGDLVLTSPVLRELRRAYPSAAISVLLQKQYANLLERCPHINELLLYDSRLVPPRQWARCLAALAFAATSLWRRNFDVTILPRWFMDFNYSSALVFFSRAPKRISSDLVKSDRVGAESHKLLFTEIEPQTKVRHEVEQKLAAINSLIGAPSSQELEIWVDQSDRSFVDKLRDDLTEDKPLIAFGIGGSLTTKKWSASNFADLAEWLVQTFDVNIVILGGTEDKNQAHDIRLRSPKRIINIAGLATLRQVASLLKSCALYVGNDTGVMHIAATYKVPVVAIFLHPADAATNVASSPERYGPWKTKHRIVQPAALKLDCIKKAANATGLESMLLCHANSSHCIDQISVAAVKAAIEKLISHDRFTFSKRSLPSQPRIAPLMEAKCH